MSKAGSWTETASKPAVKCPQPSLVNIANGSLTESISSMTAALAFCEYLQKLKIPEMGDIGIQASAAAEKYSIPHETQKLFREEIIKNPLISKFLPREANGFANKVKIVGSDAPSIPISRRFAESVASLRGLEATAINVLLAKKYGVKPQEVVINM